MLAEATVQHSPPWPVSIRAFPARHATPRPAASCLIFLLPSPSCFPADPRDTILLVFHSRLSRNFCSSFFFLSLSSQLRFQDLSFFRRQLFARRLFFFFRFSLSLSLSLSLSRHSLDYCRANWIFSLSTIFVRITFFEIFPRKLNGKFSRKVRKDFHWLLTFFELSRITQFQNLWYDEVFIVENVNCTVKSEILSFRKLWE